MNISKAEQRVLHVLAKGGYIAFTRNDAGRVTRRMLHPRRARPGRLLAGRLHQTQNQTPDPLAGRPYRVTFAGLKAVRAQLDNR